MKITIIAMITLITALSANAETEKTPKQEAQEKEAKQYCDTFADKKAEPDMWEMCFKNVMNDYKNGEL